MLKYTGIWFDSKCAICIFQIRAAEVAKQHDVLLMQFCAKGLDNKVNLFLFFISEE